MTDLTPQESLSALRIGMTMLAFFLSGMGVGGLIFGLIFGCG